MHTVNMEVCVVCTGSNYKGRRRQRRRPKYIFDYRSSQGPKHWISPVSLVFSQWFKTIMANDLFFFIFRRPRRWSPRCRNCLFITPILRRMSCFCFVLFTNGAFNYSVICFQWVFSHKFHCDATCKRNYVNVSMVLDLLVGSPISIIIMVEKRIFRRALCDYSLGIRPHATHFDAPIRSIIIYYYYPFEI